MTDPHAITARLLQVHYALFRCGTVLLTRASPEELGGENVKVAPADAHECRAFTDPDEAEQFIRRAIADGDIICMGWNPAEESAWYGLQGFAEHLDGEVSALIIGPAGAARVLLSADDLPHAAQVIGTASLMGLPVVLEQGEA